MKVYLPGGVATMLGAWLLAVRPGSAAVETPTARPTGDPSAALFDAGRLLEVRIQMATQDWNHLRLEHHELLAALGPTRFEHPEPKPYTVYRATVTINGVDAGQVGLRKRAFLGSASLQRPALSVRFDAFDKKGRFAGLRRLSLNNNLQDPSLVHQVLSYRLFARAGVPTPRCNLAWVTVNGKDLGIYSHVEAVEEDFLDRNFSNHSGNLYEGQVSDFRTNWVKTFERKNHKSSPDRGDLESVVQALQSDDAHLLAQLDPLLDVEEYLTYWAMETLIGHWDSYSNGGNNFLIYRKPDTKKFVFIPWGADSTLGDPDPFARVKTPESVKAGMILPYRLYHLPGMRERYRQRLREVLKTTWNESELLAEVTRLEAMVRSHNHVRSEHFQAGLATVRAFIRSRRSELERELLAPAPEWPIPPKATACLEKVGELRATFTATWPDEPSPSKPRGRMRLELNGTEHNYANVNVLVGPATDPRNAGCPAITLVAMDWLGAKAQVPVFVIQPEFFKPGVTNQLDGFGCAGFLLEGRLLQLDIKFASMVLGTLELREAGMTPGDKVSGKIAADIYQWP
ncbi:MAG: CotH kinase family protein [Verrucomicrobiota bacterium]